MTIPRFRQSLAKILIQRCPADLKKVLDGEEFKTTDAMDAGSVLDQIVFGGAAYHETKEKWTTKAGRQERDEAKAKGLIPVRPGDVGELSGLAGAVRTKLTEIGIDLDSPHTFKQRTINWVSEDGVECTGTPDVYTCQTLLDDDNEPYTLVKVVDMKATISAHPKTFRYQVHKMCWDVQAHAYKEAALSQAEADGYPNPVYGGHTMLAAERTGTDRVKAYPLSEKYLRAGKRRWVQAEEQWVWCHKTGEWPDYEEAELDPPEWEQDDEQGDDLSELGLIFVEEES